MPTDDVRLTREVQAMEGNLLRVAAQLLQLALRASRESAVARHSTVVAALFERNDLAPAVEIVALSPDANEVAVRVSLFDKNGEPVASLLELQGVREGGPCMH